MQAFVRKFMGGTASRTSTVPSRAHVHTAEAVVAAATTPAAAAAAASSDLTSMATVTRVPHSSLHVSKPTWWLESRFHFSFADYWDPARENFGVLRVLNDDLVKAGAGFGAHPHRDAEIFSYVVSGQLSHADSMGNKEALPRGCVQYMSAGTGVMHSELNEGGETCRFLQLWITPDRRGHKPQYGSSSYDKSDRHNRLLQILGGTGSPPEWPNTHNPHSIRLHQDANVFVSESEPGVRFDLSLGPTRQAYLICIEGDLRANDVQLDTRDGARLVGAAGGVAGGAAALSLTAGPTGAHFLIVEMARSTR
ncbi:hypothetical protein PLESTB_001728900 [Pleodorina starrii]|uniref:Uncharacterized protein n=1 Tax=Pleodorina starrii TaxID=330485 RepID=A0A9W6FA10_9CHLO|nr:hypothetical protein PLESTM_000731100 [Pleodorina starrii]GLC61186.1 hypothetical protein PLESTB_001728900 [Pleodorina starrii]GLC75747.1 hypothetical protein PLESTF_001681100 [Pleodorina starrii]